MSTEITISNSNYEHAIEDLRSLPEIIANPRLRIVQPQSELITDGEAKAGQWHIEGMDSNAIPNPLIVTPKRVRFVRRLWKDDEIECSSDDGWQGVGNPGGDCSECTLKDWIDGDKPKCTAGLEFGFEIDKLGVTVICEFKGSSLKAANLLVTNWRNQTDNGVMDSKFQLTLSKRNGPNKSTYFVPIAKLLA